MKRVLQTMMVVLLLFLGGCGGEKRLETRMINGESIVFQVGSKKPYSGPYTITGYNNNGSTYRKQEGEYKKGKLNGINKWYYKNGNILEEAEFKLGQLSGKYKKYYYDGRISEEAKYKLGKLNGMYKAYYNNSQLRYEGEYKLGVKKGIHTTYSIYGEIWGKENYSL